MNQRVRCVWLAGWSADERCWQPVIERLPEAEHQVISFLDMPPSAEEIASRLHIAPPFVLIGWSMGAFLALQYAAAYPQHVTEVCVVSGASQFITQKREARLLERMMRRVTEDLEQVLQEFDGRLFTAMEVKCISATKRVIRGCVPDAKMLLDGLGYLRTVSVRKLAPWLPFPVHLLSGAADPICPVAGAEELAELLPQGDLTVWPEVGHAPFLSQPDRFVAWMKERCNID
ncbi:carboxylesterase BioH (pimeloyl-CoA synthesis) [Laceyella sacchari]|uniref:alpha/beta fold hydrolase n=1 Tax=Laceyella sacchari TaxID=37482 RepID=UPI00104CBB6B|nr:alpha/beta fold hydrolase [Laceyella sacchari]TCW38885.1 carboxylesterase BioH (pimeloyl-CoA synthesis) [Laceyella sacchari]